MSEPSSIVSIEGSKTQVVEISTNEISVEVTTTSAEVIISNEQGPQGPQGLQGIAGEYAAQGIQGPQGLQGIQGPLPDPSGYATLVDGTVPTGQLPANIVYTDGLNGALGDYVPLTDKANPNGVATLDVDGLLTTMQLPPFVRLDVEAYSPYVGVLSGLIAPSTGVYSTDFVTWTETVLPETAYYWHVTAYGNGKYVAVASDSTPHGAISTDGITWTSIVFPLANVGAIAYGGAGVFLAVSSYYATAAYSTDGITWTSVALPALGSINEYQQAIAVGDTGTFVVPRTYSTTAVRSTDGVTWTVSTLPSSSGWSHCVYGNGKFVALAESMMSTDNAASSTDGITWSLNSMPSSTWQTLEFGHGKFVSVSKYDWNGGIEVTTSTDGVTWSTPTVVTSAGIYPQFVETTDNGFAIYAGQGSLNYFSTDTVTWTTAAKPGFTGALLQAASTYRVTRTLTPTDDFVYLDGVTSNVQVQLNSKANTSALAGYATLTSGTVPTNQLPGNLVYSDGLAGALGDYVPLTDKANPNGVATLDIDGLVPVEQLPNIAVVPDSASTITISSTQVKKMVVCSNPVATSVVISSDLTNLLPTGSYIVVYRKSPGTVTISAAEPLVTTIESAAANPSLPTLRAQYSSAVIVKQDANLWTVLGDIA